MAFPNVFWPWKWRSHILFLLCSRFTCFSNDGNILVAKYTRSGTSSRLYNAYILPSHQCCLYLIQVICYHILPRCFCAFLHPKASGDSGRPSFGINSDRYKIGLTCRAGNANFLAKLTVAGNSTSPQRRIDIWCCRNSDFWTAGGRATVPVSISKLLTLARGWVV